MLHSLILWSFSSKSSTHHYTQTVRAIKLTFWEKVHPMWWSLSVEGLLSKGPTPSSFYNIIKKLIEIHCHWKVKNCINLKKKSLGLGQCPLRELEEGHYSLTKRNIFNRNHTTVFWILSTLCSVLLWPLYVPLVWVNVSITATQQTWPTLSTEHSQCIWQNLLCRHTS